VFGLGQGRDDLFVTDQGSSHVGEHGLAVATIAAETPPQLAVSHVPCLALFRARFCGLALRVIGGSSGARRRRLVASINTGPQSAWPDPRCCRAANSALPCQDAGPCWPAPPLSRSVTCARSWASAASPPRSSGSDRRYRRCCRSSSSWRSARTVPARRLFSATPR